VFWHRATSPVRVARLYSNGSHPKPRTYIDSFGNQILMTTTYATAILSIVVAIAFSVAAFRIGYMPFVIATSILGVIFGAVVVSIGLRLSFRMPWYVYTLFGSIGGFIGLRLGMYIPSCFVTHSTEFMTNFEYNRVYAWHRFIHRMLLTFAILGGGTIGLGVSGLPRGVDEPSDAPKSPPVSREFES
jgi:hypothetical protein